MRIKAFHRIESGGTVFAVPLTFREKLAVGDETYIDYPFKFNYPPEHRGPRMLEPLWRILEITVNKDHLEVKAEPCDS